MQCSEKFMLAFLCLCTICNGLDSPSRIKIVNNGYQFMVVAIHDSIPDDPSLLQKLKDIFTKASGVLYTATRHRAYFQKVFFLVPKTWQARSGYTNSGAVTLRAADVIISDPKRASRRNFPHTRSYAGCGHSGIHMQLTKDVFLKNSHPLIQNKPEKYLVHEFAKYRYGVFDEFPNPGENQFYFSTVEGRLDPVRCSRGLIGYIMNFFPNGSRALCPYTSVNPVTGEFPQGCKYYPYPQHNRGKSSMMDHQYITEITDFCDDTVDNLNANQFGHNREPPNRHNRLCGHRSTWDVISQTVDFQNNKNPPRTISNQTPQFIIFRASSRRKRMVLVVDSPSDASSQLEVHQAVDHFLRDGLSDDTRVAVLHGGTDQTEHIKFRKPRSVSLAGLRSNCVTSSMDRNIERGLKLLKKYNKRNSGVDMHIVLSYCGESSNITRELIRKTVDANVIPHIIHCHGNDLDHIKDITTEQGGLFESKHPRAMHQTMYRLSENLHEERHTPIQILNEKVGIPSDSKYTRQFSVDESLYGTLVFKLYYNTDLPSLYIIRPNDSQITNTAYEVDTKAKSVRITLPVSGVEHGKWKYVLVNRGEKLINVTIVSQVKPHNALQTDPIRANAWFQIFEEYSPPRVGLYTEVMSGTHPVTNLVVKGRVYKDHKLVTEVSQRDSGTGADMTKDDGIYSTFFTEMNDHGGYYVEVDITDSDQKGEIHRTMEIRVPYHEKSHDSGLKYHTEKVKLKHGLSRAHSTGRFYVDRRWNLTEGHNYPPSRISDLKITHVSARDNTALLSWTATGGDLDNGRAFLYDVRFHTNGIRLLDFPDEADFVTQKDVIDGDINNPKSSGETETMTIQFPKNLKWVAVQIRAVDDQNNAGQFSNMVTTDFKHVPH